ncbi:hypothetical protein MMC11_003843 [Xylographa trunciseda]|nr:hypothetical protein [Xylographa trunciseda]
MDNKDLDNVEVMHREETAHAAQISAVKGDDDLCSRIQALAQEIQDMILDFLIKVSLNPGKVYFGKTTGINVSPSLLKIPNRALHKEAITRLFANNTWVLPRGDVREAELLLKLPQPYLFSIRSMELTFSWNDGWSPPLGSSFKPINNRAPERRTVGESVERALAAVDYRCERAAWTNKVLRIWSEKYDLLRGLPLEHLRLDFSAAYDMDDLFLVSPLVDLLVRTFTYGLPPHLEIVAYTKKFELIIRDIIGKENQHLVQDRVCSMCEAGLHVPRVEDSNMEDLG